MKNSSIRDQKIVTGMQVLWKIWQQEDIRPVLLNLICAMTYFNAKSIPPLQIEMLPIFIMYFTYVPTIFRYDIF